LNRLTPGPESPSLNLLTCPDWQDYELLDSGGGAKLERYGAYTFVRPEHQAVWKRVLPDNRWKSVDAVFEPVAGDESGGRWRFHKPIPDGWEMSYKGLRFTARATASRHMGVFPEQAAHWDWMEALIRARMSRQPASAPLRVLNLFGYTGLATLAAARAGAFVTHVDASKKAIAWARENQAQSGLADRPIRWLIDDAFKFVRREARRESLYEAILLDPPKFGRGPEGQVWEFFDGIGALLAECRSLLSPRPLFIVLTAYAIRASALSLHYAMQEMTTGLEGTLTSGELTLMEKSAGRLLGTSIFSRWQAGGA
jgi:23S rRNA (cytosine1962-C5)-methyltransferase